MTSCSEYDAYRDPNPSLNDSKSWLYLLCQTSFLVLSPSHFIKQIHLHSFELTSTHSRIYNFFNLLKVH